MKVLINTILKTSLFFLIIAFIVLTGCQEKTDSSNQKVEDNIKKYSQVWDEILNKRKLEMFNENNFAANAVLHTSPNDIVGIDNLKAYYANFLTGFSDIEFTIKDVFGQGDKLVKYWVFKGTHTGMFFGIPATGNKVNLEGTTLVRMDDDKIAEERDFYDNLDFLQQLGVIPVE
jgi:steroid delta-isomerase-like uncharacterized protein